MKLLVQDHRVHIRQSWDFRPLVLAPVFFTTMATASQSRHLLTAQKILSGSKPRSFWEVSIEPTKGGPSILGYVSLRTMKISHVSLHDLNLS